jgi:nucleoside-diphosphate-sugar epimerase
MDIVTNKPVLVTGANGFLGSHIIQQLLFRGYSVRGVIRPHLSNSTGSDSSSAVEGEIIPRYSDFISAPSTSVIGEKPSSAYEEAMKAIFSPYSRISGIHEKLEFIEADLTTSDNWDKVFSGGIEAVIHVASPYLLKPENPQVALINPAVEGTRRILELCQSTSSVKKLVYISCINALTDEFDNSKEYSEDDWNTTSSLQRNSYAYSKTMAEKLVHSFAKQVGCRFQVVALLPGMMWGPPIGNKLFFLLFCFAYCLFFVSCLLFVSFCSWSSSQYFS